MQTQHVVVSWSMRIVATLILLEVRMKMFHSVLAFTAVFVLVFGMSNPAFAQRGGGRGMLGFNRAQLISLNEVQGELKLTDDQKSLAKGVFEKYSADVRDVFQNAGGDFAAMAEKTAKLASEATAKVVEKLDETQKARLTQIFVQTNGTNALLDSMVQTSLKVTEEQGKKLNDARNVNREAMMSAFGSLQGASAEERQSKMDELQKTATEKLFACISSDQKAEFEKLGGAKLTVDTSPLIPRRPNN